MSLLDTLAELVRHVLPPSARDFLWFPVFIGVLFTALMLLFRKALPVVGRIATAGLRGAATGLGAVLLLPDLAVATAFRWFHLRPPALVYGYGDAVASAAIGLVGAAGATTTVFSRVARTHAVVVMLCCAGLLWLWNDGHCGEADTANPCVRPVATWVEGLD